VDRDEACVDDGGQDDKKMGANAKAGDWKASGRAVKSFGEGSLTIATDRVEYSKGVVIRVEQLAALHFVGVRNGGPGTNE
jgi:hypothetical protein